MRSTSTSYSSRISPTISSSRSSTVTRPAVPPYSSTTIALCSRLRWNSFSRSGHALGLRHEVRRPNQRRDRPAQRRRRTALQQVLDEDEALDVVERLLEHRDARVLLLAEQRVELLDGRVVLDRDDVGPRRHHLAHHRFAEVGEVAQQLARLAFLHGFGAAPAARRRGRRRRLDRRRRLLARARWSRTPDRLRRRRLVPRRSSAEVSGLSSRAMRRTTAAARRARARDRGGRSAAGSGARTRARCR